MICVAYGPYTWSRRTTITLFTYWN